MMISAPYARRIDNDASSDTLYATSILVSENSVRSFVMFLRTIGKLFSLLYTHTQKQQRILVVSVVKTDP